MPLKTRPGPNVSTPSGDIFPSGMILTPSPIGVAASVRPFGSVFQKSPGYDTIRPGATKFQDGWRGGGIHFVGIHTAEDLSSDDPGGPPAMVNTDDALKHADLATIPGSEYLDDEGNVPHLHAEANMGTKFQQDKTFPTGGGVMHEEHKSSYISDGSRGSILDVEGDIAYGKGLFRNPAGAFRQEWAQSPVVAVGVAAVIVSVLYMVGKDLDRAWDSRRPRGAGAGAAAGSAAAAAPAAVETAGKEASKATETAADAVKAAGDAVEDATKIAADAVSDK